MCLTGINDGFKLRIGQQTLGDDCRRKVRPIGRRHRRHRGGLNQLGEMWLSARNADRLKRIFFVKRLCNLAALSRCFAEAPTT